MRCDVLTSATRAEERNHAEYDASARQRGLSSLTFRARRDDGRARHGASAASMSFILAKQVRDSGLPADVLVGKLEKDMSLALRRGRIAQVT
jgi:hypothetical protein